MEKTSMREIEASLNNDADYLYDLCDLITSNDDYRESIKQHADAFQVLHLKNWHINNQMCEVSTMKMSNSILTFSICAYLAEVDSQIKVPLSLLSNIQNKWIHPIIRTQKVIFLNLKPLCDLLCGLEWLVYSDFKIDKKDLIHDIFSVVYAIKQKIFYYIRSENINPIDFNITKYYNDNNGKLEINNVFLMEMDNKITYLELELCDAMDVLSGDFSIKHVDVARFAAKLKEECALNFEESDLKREIDTWNANLQIHPSYNRLFKIQYGLFMPVIVERILTITNPDFKLTTTDNNDALLFYYSSQNDEIVKDLINDKLIYRVQVLNVWFFDGFYFRSLTEAFCYLLTSNNKCVKNVKLEYSAWV